MPPTYTMNFDVNFASTYEKWGGIEPMSRAAQHAEDVGLYGIQFGEHITIPGVWYDNFVLASHFATLTKRIRLTWNVLVVPYRPAIMTAKMLSTLDVVSNGRITATMTAGWMEREFKDLGLPFPERGPMTDEAIRAMKILWTQDDPVFEGKYISFKNIVFEPKCVQKPHIPIWIGGSKPRAIRRVIELGDGWSPDGGTPAETATRITYIKEQVRGAGRDPSKMTFAHTIGVGQPGGAQGSVHGTRSVKYFPDIPLESDQQVIEHVEEYRKAGVSLMSFRFNWEKPVDYMKRMEWIAAKIMPAFKAKP